MNPALRSPLTPRVLAEFTVSLFARPWRVLQPTPPLRSVPDRGRCHRCAPASAQRDHGCDLFAAGVVSGGRTPFSRAGVLVKRCMNYRNADE